MKKNVLASSFLQNLLKWGIGILLLVSGISCTQGPAQDDRVEALLAEMTLAEKAGQMTQLTLQAVSKTAAAPGIPHELDPEKLAQMIVEEHVGSILNVYDMAFSLAYWRELITAIQDVATKETRLGIPIIYGVDAVHGANYIQEGTLFPQNIGLAATWNPDLAYQAGKVTAYETRASGVPWNFSPVLDLGRQPLWSRFFETLGEDVFLARTLGQAHIEGLQAADGPHVAACAKHFLGYSFPLSGKDRTPAWIPERMLREYFLPPFESAMEAGVKTVMVNSGEINGIPTHVDHYILTDVLRGELGFEGVAVTDWEDIIKLHTVHKVAADEREAVRMAVMAGVDMSMTPYSTEFKDYLVDLVEAGEIPMSRIDTSVRRILQLKFDLGLFDDPYPASDLDQVGSEDFENASRQATAESITLLKNDGNLLPLNQGARVLVTGPTATSLPALYGSWSYTWQGTNVDAYPAGRDDVVTALRAKLGAGQVSYVPGTTMDEVVNINAAVAAARQADVIIACVGENPSTEKPGDIDDLALAPAQVELVRALQATDKPVVLVLIQNRPRLIREIVEGSRAIINTYEPGPYGPEVLADILFGDVNPSGKLPFTYPQYAGSLVPYDYKNSERGDRFFGQNAIQPQFAFGHGLSYTTFAYDNLVVTPAGDQVTVSVNVTNTGHRAGQEVVQLYVTDVYASITPPNRRLRGFEKIQLDAGASQTVSFTVSKADVSFVGAANTWIFEAGEFEAHIGDQTTSFDWE